MSDDVDVLFSWTIYIRRAGFVVREWQVAGTELIPARKDHPFPDLASARAYIQRIWPGAVRLAGDSNGIIAETWL